MDRLLYSFHTTCLLKGRSRREKGLTKAFHEKGVLLWMMVFSCLHQKDSIQISSRSFACLVCTYHSWLAWGIRYFISSAAATPSCNSKSLCRYPNFWTAEFDIWIWTCKTCVQCRALALPQLVTSPAALETKCQASVNAERKTEVQCEFCANF